MPSTVTTCGYCGCGCNIHYITEGSAIVSAFPSPDHPVNKGKLCAKGWNGHAFVRHPDRLRTSLARNASGKLAPVSWDEALSLVARRFQDLARKHGAESLGVFSSARCTNEENYLMARYARAVLQTPHIDHCARL